MAARNHATRWQKRDEHKPSCEWTGVDRRLYLVSSRDYQPITPQHNVQVFLVEIRDFIRLNLIGFILLLNLFNQYYLSTEQLYRQLSSRTNCPSASGVQPCLSFDITLYIMAIVLAMHSLHKWWWLVAHNFPKLRIVAVLTL